MRIRVLILGVCLACVPVLAATQDLLPAALGEWSSFRAMTVGPQEIESVAGLDASILRDFGVTGAEHRTYSRGVSEFDITVYIFSDSTTAFGAFSFLRLDAWPASSPAGATNQRRKLERTLLGNLILDYAGDGQPLQRKALASLQKQLLAWADGAPYPLLLQYLPTQGLIRGSERFVLAASTLSRVLPIEPSDWVGFRYGAEAQLARYHSNGRAATLLLISYPTPQAAQLKQAELGRWFNVDNSETAPTNRPVAHVRRILSVLAIAVEADSAESAKALLDNVQYQPNFSWNEPGHRATDTPILYRIYGILVGIGVLLAFTLVAGISFGGVRIVTKYFFPGKVFDRTEAIEILQLGIYSKPIEAKDFYMLPKASSGS